MFHALIRTLLGRSFTGDDRANGRGRRASGGGQSSQTGGVLLEQKPPVLRRRTINLIAVLGIAVILYGALMPFQIAPEKTFSWRLEHHGPTTGDAVSNVLIYVPIGAFLRLMFRRRGSWRLGEWLMSLIVACGLSYLTEVVQTVVVARVPSWTDAACNFGGAIIGIAMGPLFQRMLRNVHAWLYQELRTRPMSTAAATALLCVCVYALAPLDIKPTPAHVGKAIQHLRSLPTTWIWLPGNASFKPTAVMDKMIAAGSYGLLAFVLLLSAREAGRAVSTAAWYALSRSVALAIAVEGLQLFTISHAAEPQDLISAWLSSLLGCAVGWRIVSHSPDIHRSPLTLLQGIAAVISGVMLAWAVGSVVLTPSPTVANSPSTWWPGVSNFHRSWNSLLGDYTTGLLQYILIAGLLVLWYRSTRRRPPRVLTIGAAMMVAVVALGVGRYRGFHVDTAQILLALLGGIVAIRIDRAIFGKRALLASAAATEPGPPAAALDAAARLDLPTEQQPCPSGDLTHLIR